MELQDFVYKTKPFEHQEIAVQRSWRSKYYAYLMDLGTGKTKVTLDVAALMYLNGWINAMLVFGNKGSYLNWEDAVKEHLAVPYSIGIWSSKGSKKYIEEMMKAIYTPKKCLRVFLVNIEAIVYDRALKTAMDFVVKHHTLAVCDESTTIKNPDAKRTKAAISVGAKARARRILTGSPVDNRPLDAWSQFQFLCNGALGYNSYYSFRNQYAELEDSTITQKGNVRSFKKVTGYKNLERLKESISKISYIVKKEDCLDLPEKLPPIFYNVELTEVQAKMYQQLKQYSIAEIEAAMKGTTGAGKAKQYTNDILDFLSEFDIEAFSLESQTYKKIGSEVVQSSNSPLITVKLAITKILRLHQLVCGHIKDDDGIVHDIDSNRLNALGEILEETKGKVVIWTSFSYDVKKIYEFISKKYGAESVCVYDGSTKDADRAFVKAAFKRGGEIDGLDFLIANDRAGGYGNNWTAITTAIYYSYDHDFDKHHQTQDRIYRIGQTMPVSYVYLRAKNTIDEVILDVLRNKKNIADLLIQSNWKDLFY